MDRLDGLPQDPLGCRMVSGCAPRESSENTFKHNCQSPNRSLSPFNPNANLPISPRFSSEPTLSMKFHLSENIYSVIPLSNHPEVVESLSVEDRSAPSEVLLDVDIFFKFIPADTNSIKLKALTCLQSQLGAIVLCKPHHIWGRTAREGCSESLAIFIKQIGIWNMAQFNMFFHKVTCRSNLARFCMN